MGIPPKASPARWVGVVGLLLVTFYVIIAHTLPFNPYTIHGYSAFPDWACFNASVNVDLHYTLKPTDYGNSSNFEGETYWQEDGGSRRTISQPFGGTFDDMERGTHIVPSPVIRIAPPEEGTWRLVTKMDIYGRMLLFPRHASVHFESAPVLTTLPADDPRCLP